MITCPTERRIVSHLVRALLKEGWAVSVHDEDGRRLRPSTSYKAIMTELGACDYEAIAAHANGEWVGQADFIYGNGNGGCDVIADGRMTPGSRFDVLFEEALTYAGSLES